MAALTVVKEVPNAVLFEDAAGQKYIRLDGVRTSYCYVGNPSEDENDDGVVTKRWRSNFLLPKKTHGQAMKLCKEIIEELMSANDAKVPKDKWFISDGDDKEDENMAGMWIVTAADAKVKPKCRNEDGELMSDPDEIDDKFYSGCFVDAMIRPWYFSGKAKGKPKTYPKRVSAGLVGVMFDKDGERFGAAPVDESDAWGKKDSTVKKKTTSKGKPASSMDDDDDGEL